MSNKPPKDWQKQARADLFSVWDDLDELNDIADKIGKALDEDSYELYQQAISGLAGLEES